MPRIPGEIGLDGGLRDDRGSGGDGDEEEPVVDEDVPINRGRLKTLLGAGDAIPSALGVVEGGLCDDGSESIEDDEEPAGDLECIVDDADIILGRLKTLREVGDAAVVTGAVAAALGVDGPTTTAAAVEAPLGRAATLGRGRVPEPKVLRLATCPREDLPRDSSLSIVAEDVSPLRPVLRAVCGFPTFEVACVENRVFFMNKWPN